MVSEKGDVTSTDTINRGYVWASTNTTTKSRSGSTSADYNQIIIFGKNNINKSINLGFTFIPEASSKSKYSDDFSTSNFRKGNGMIIGGAIVLISTDTVYEGGILIEQESKDSGDGNKRDLFFLYETLIGGGSLLASCTNSETEKLKDGSTNVARPTSATTIDLQTQIDFEGGMYVSREVFYTTASALGASLFRF